MAPKTIKAAIKDTLANLSKEKFAEFVEQLLDRREEPRVKRYAVEGKNHLSVSNILVSTFTERRAPQVVAEILRDIDCSEEADRLVETCGQPSQPGSNDAAGPSPGATGGNTVANAKNTNQHFVDKYQLELIDRVTNVDPILDELCFKKVIGKQKYETIRKMLTSYDKIREIYPSLEASDECKDIFYEILTRHEKYLIHDLHKNK